MIQTLLEWSFYGSERRIFTDPLISLRCRVLFLFFERAFLFGKQTRSKGIMHHASWPKPALDQ